MQVTEIKCTIYWMLVRWQSIIVTRNGNRSLPVSNKSEERCLGSIPPHGLAFCDDLINCNLDRPLCLRTSLPSIWKKLIQCGKLERHVLLLYLSVILILKNFLTSKVTHTGNWWERTNNTRMSSVLGNLVITNSLSVIKEAFFISFTTPRFCLVWFCLFINLIGVWVKLAAFRGQW